MQQKAITKDIMMLSTLLSRKIIASCPKDKEERLGRNGFMITYILSRKEDTYQRDIENYYKLRRSTVTIALKKMEQNGLITRESVESDSRLKKIVVTEKAKKLHELFIERMNVIESELKNQLTEEEINNFYSVAGKLKEILDDKKIG